MKRKKIIVRLALILALFVLSIVTYAFLSVYSYKPEPMPNPNGFDDFVKAGLLIQYSGLYPSEMNRVQLNAFVATNKAALKIARTGLERECRVPDKYSTNTMDEFLVQGGAVRKLAMGFDAEAKLANFEGRTNDVIENALDLITLGVKSSRGGFILWKAIGVDREKNGRSLLQGFTNSLADSDCRKISRSIETVDTEEDSIAEILSHENQLELKGTTILVKIRTWRSYLDEPGLRKHFITKFQANTLDRRKLMLAFAARAYELEKGKPPPDAAALVPDYLKRIPKDPTTGTNLTLHP